MKIEAKDKILKALKKSGKELTKKELFKLSKIKNEQEFKNALYQLEDNGEIVIGKKKTVATPQMLGYVKAEIVRSSKYFSFAKPVDGSQDLYIPCEKMKMAFPGDTVMLKNIREEDKGPAASVARILKKGPRTLTGMIERSNGKYFIIPDSGFAFDIPVVKGGTLKAKNGDKVRAALSINQKEKRIYARVLKIYGKADSAKICADAIIDRYGIPHEFSKGLRCEAKRVSSQPITQEEINGREDLRQEQILTIDGADAKDLDDAVSVKKTNDGWLLGVHIADVSHYIKPDSELDKEAFSRGTSVYFADRVIPMLPEEISNGCCSLNSGTDKLTFSAIMHIDKNGNLGSFKFCKSVINSKVRGVYSEVNSIFSGEADPDILEKYSPVMETLTQARKLANVLKARSASRGELEIETSELRFVLDEFGVCCDVAVRERGEAEELIEQFMIMANQAAAMLAKESQLPFVYRVHEHPQAERIASLSSLAQACGFRVNKLKPDLDQNALAELLAASKGTRYEKLMSMQVLRTMAKAKYDSHPLGHFGLSLDDYCHFTSPIRRYPDTSIHRILSDFVDGMPVEKITKKYDKFAEDSAKNSSECEIRAVNAERDTEKCYAAEYMTKHIGEEYDGIVEGVTAKGIFVSIPNGIEGFINLINASSGGHFEFNGTTTIKDYKTGESYSIGDDVRIKVISASVALGTVDFELVY